MTLRASVVGAVFSSLIGVLLLVNCVGDEPASVAGAEGDGGAGDASPDQATPSDGASPSDGSTHLDSGPGCVAPTSAHPGTLDPSYGNSLKTVATFSSPEAAAVDPLGRVYVAGVGTCSSVANTDLAVMRFDANGGVDTTFNAGSAVKCFDLGDVEHAYGIAIDGAGKILLSGISGHSATGRFFPSVVRFDDHAVPDSTFGTGGVVDLLGASVDAQPGVQFFTVAFGVAIVPVTNKIVVVGSDSNINTDSSTGFIERLNNDGSADIGFGTNGIYRETVNVSFFNAVIDSTGAVTAPSGQYPVDEQIVALRLDSSGKVVSSGSIPDLGHGDVAHTIVQRANGSVLVVGGRGDSAAAAAVAFNPDGGVDTTFGTAGIQSLPMTYNTYSASNLAAQYCNGDFFVASQNVTTDAAAQDTALVHLSANGALDTTYGTSGIARAFYVGGDIPVSAMVDPVTQKILVVGRDGSGRVGIFRFEP